MIGHVVIVGGGFSGSLTAINLARHGGPRATLIERRAAAGVGVAYGAAHPSHLLNVRASNMSAYPDDPAHFARWIEARGGSAAGFMPRLAYGDYLRENLKDARRSCGGRLDLLSGDVVDIVPGTPPAVLLADGRRIAADAVILAPGNLPPHAPARLVGEPAPPAYFSDPWDAGIADGLGDDDRVVIIGTGLTMVDVTLKLDAAGYRGRIVAVSRRGLLPHAHAAGAPSAGLPERPPVTAAALLRAVRGRAAETGWRQAVDELRPYTQAMWRAAAPPVQRRFLRHLRPWWDIHRHRLAPEVAARLQAMQDEGRLEIAAASPIALAAEDGAMRITLRRRGSSVVESITAARAINCTGPQGDVLRSAEPLLVNLLGRGLIRPDALRLGIDVTQSTAVIAAGGRPSDWLFAIGPMTRGAFWEIVAVPDIRQQAWTLARRLAQAHWVEGEGL